MNKINKFGKNDKFILSLQVKDVQLKIKFYTKDYVMRSLPRSFRGKLIHLSCLAILCEKFHDIMGCVATPEKGVVKFVEEDKDLFVSSVSINFIVNQM